MPSEHKFKNTSDFRRHEIQKAAQVLADAMVGELDVRTRNCANCDNYNHKAEICAKYNTRPPCQVIVTGCPEWVDSIPF